MRLSNPLAYRRSSTSMTWPWAVKPCFVVGLALFCTSLRADAQERWFQIEVSVFSNESIGDRLEENWQARRTNLGLPAGIRRLNEISDTLIIDEFLPQAEENSFDEASLSVESTTLTAPVDFVEPTAEELLLQALMAVQPSSQSQGVPFKFIDVDRDDYLRLPASESDFTQTNRTLDRSAEHRMLWHGVWRQAVLAPEQAEAIYVAGGERYGEHHELEGSLTIRFNDGADRVVIDTNLWLAEYSLSQSTFSANELPQDQNSWQLPPHPGEEFYSKQQLLEESTELTSAGYNIARVYHMVQSRAMRSAEFHYLDHPAIGVVVVVNPYTVPSLLPQNASDIVEPGITQ
ncbi:MAG: hypothetical protein ACI95C_002323 [Pseudohongiellaceae bacterium]|jgi:hypothetical protein